MQGEVIRIAIVHRDGLYRDCLSFFLAQAETMSIVHSTSRLEEAEEVLDACRPDLVIVEFGLCFRKDLGDTWLSRSVSMGLKIIVVGVPDTEEDVLACIERGGAAGYLLMDASLKDFMNNVQAVMKGETVCSPRIASLAFTRVSTLWRHIAVVRPNPGNGARLTRREAEIVRLIDDGLSNKEIAVRLHIEVSTVKNHVHNILDKLQLHNRYSAVKHIKEQAIAIGRS